MHKYVQFVDICKKFLDFSFQGLYKVWRARYYPVCRLVRNQIGTIKEPGALLLLSLSPPITPKLRSRLFPFTSNSFQTHQPINLWSWATFNPSGYLHDRFRDIAKKRSGFR